MSLPVKAIVGIAVVLLLAFLAREFTARQGRMRHARRRHRRLGYQHAWGRVFGPRAKRLPHFPAEREPD